jgi:hypothetical protein
MSTTVREERQVEFLSTLRKGQDVALDALKALTEAIQFVSPVVPTVHVRLARRLPPAHQMVADANDFAERLLANQRQFADEVITVMSPLLAGKASEPAEATGESEASVGSKGMPVAAA